MRPKIVVTGNRNYKDEETVTKALIKAQMIIGTFEINLIHGAASGLDSLAEKIVKTHPAFALWTITPMPADWSKYGKKAGPIRNNAMLDLRPYLTLGFPLHPLNLPANSPTYNTSRGTWNCLTNSAQRGIHTIVVWNNQMHPMNDNTEKLLEASSIQSGGLIA